MTSARSTESLVAEAHGLSGEWADVVYVVRLSPNPTFVYVSTSIEDLVGVSVDSHLSDPWLASQLVGAIDLGDLTNPVTDAPHSLLLPWPTKDGRLVWMRHMCRLVAESDDARVLLGAARDVSDQVAHDAALRSALGKYRLLAENASDVLLLIRADGLVDWVSPSVLALTGWPASSLLGHSPWDLIHPDDRAAAIAVLAEAAVSVETLEPVLLRLLVAGDRYAWVSARGRQVDLAEGGRRLVVSLRMVDDLVHAREAAEKGQALLQAAMDSLLDPYVVLLPVRDARGEIVDFTPAEANNAACLDIGLDRQQLLASTLMDLSSPELGLSSPEAGSAFVSMFAHVMDSGEPLSREDYSFRTPTTDSDTRIDVRAVRAGPALGLTWRDVSERHEAHEVLSAAKDRFQQMAEESSDVVMAIPSRQVLWVSPSIGETLGWTREEWLGRHVDDYVHPDDRAWFAQAGMAVRRGEDQVVRFRMRTRAEAYHWVEAHARPYTESAEQQDRAVVSFRLVDSEVAAEVELERRARNDELTGLLNRKELFDRLEHVNRGRRSGDRLAVLFCDIDDFKAVNDRAGHAAGDALLRTVADRIRATVRRADLVGRVGGDEIVVVLGSVNDEAESIDIANKIREAVAWPIDLPTGSERVTMSIGCTLTQDDEGEDAVIARADRAMYLAKESGRDRVVSLLHPTHDSR